MITFLLVLYKFLQIYILYIGAHTHTLDFYICIISALFSKMELLL